MFLELAEESKCWLVWQSVSAVVVGAVGGVEQTGRTAVVGVSGLPDWEGLEKECG